MKFLSACLFLLVLVFFSSCKKVDKLLTFKIRESQTFTVPRQAIIPGLHIPGAPVTFNTNSEEEFKNNNTRANLVKDVSLDKIILTIEDPATEDFGFLKDMDIYISSDNTDEIKIAYLHNVPANVGNTIELISTKAKLDKYVKASTFKVRASATLDETVSNDLTIKMDLTFKVTADPL